MNFLKEILTDLKAKRLWPVAALLLLAVVAVPVLLSKNASSGQAPIAQVPSAGLGGGTAAGLPAVSVSSTPSEGKLTGKSRNPFTQFGGSSGKSTSSATSSATTTPAKSNGSAEESASASGGTSSSGTSSSASSGAATSTTSTPPSITNTTPPPAPTGLSATESYQVSLAITGAGGGVDTYAPLRRLSVLPSPSRALLVELGVLQGGKRVLFAVRPGAVVEGPGTCVPGAVNCEILSLAPGQTEALGEQTSRGAEQVALFAVTDVAAVKHDSATAANQARRVASASGRGLLANSSPSVLSLFPYKPGVGAVVDLRNLTVGG